MSQSSETLEDVIFALVCLPFLGCVGCALLLRIHLRFGTYMAATSVVGRMREVAEGFYFDGIRVSGCFNF